MPQNPFLFGGRNGWSYCHRWSVDVCWGLYQVKLFPIPRPDLFMLLHGKGASKSKSSGRDQSTLHFSQYICNFISRLLLGIKYRMGAFPHVPSRICEAVLGRLRYVLSCCVFCVVGRWFQATIIQSIHLLLYYWIDRENVPSWWRSNSQLPFWLSKSFDSWSKMTCPLLEWRWLQLITLVELRATEIPGLW